MVFFSILICSADIVVTNSGWLSGWLCEEVPNSQVAGPPPQEPRHARGHLLHMWQAGLRFYQCCRYELTTRIRIDILYRKLSKLVKVFLLVHEDLVTFCLNFLKGLLKFKKRVYRKVFEVFEEKIHIRVLVQVSKQM